MTSPGGVLRYRARQIGLDSSQIEHAVTVSAGAEKLAQRPLLLAPPPAKFIPIDPDLCVTGRRASRVRERGAVTREVVRALRVYDVQPTEQADRVAIERARTVVTP